MHRSHAATRRLATAAPLAPEGGRGAGSLPEEARHLTPSPFPAVLATLVESRSVPAKGILNRSQSSRCVGPQIGELTAVEDRRLGRPVQRFAPKRDAATASRMSAGVASPLT